MVIFFFGILVGVFLVFVIIYFILICLPENAKYSFAFNEQFPPVRIPPVLARFLCSNEDEVGGSKWESCYTISTIAHFLFQEFKDTRRFRRWVYKRLQLELNDLTTRSTAGLLIQDVRVRDLSIGSEFPIVSNVRIESYHLSEDGHVFEELNLLIDVDYTGGFQASVDAALVLNRRAHLSLKLIHLSGKVRLTLTRRPYSHWSFTFIETPITDFKVESEWQGRQVKYVIPLITQQFRRMLQRRHVFPNYKIRYRPFFPNPLFVPSPSIESFAHIKVIGGLEVTVLQCSRLNLSLASEDQTEVYCTISLDQRPFLHLSSPHSNHCSTVLINFIRHGHADPLGLIFTKSVTVLGLRAVRISDVVSGSTAEKCGFKSGDTILAVNNVPIQNERQATKLLCGTAGELNVLVERTLTDVLGEKTVIKEDTDDEGFILVDSNAQEQVSVDRAVDSDQKSVEMETNFKKRERSTSSSALDEILNIKKQNSENDEISAGNKSDDGRGSSSEKIFMNEAESAIPLTVNRGANSSGFLAFRKTQSTTEIRSHDSDDADHLHVPVSRPVSAIFLEAVASKSEEELSVEDLGDLKTASSMSSIANGTTVPHIYDDAKEVEEKKADNLNESLNSETDINAKGVDKHSSRRHRLRTRAFEMAVAGKAKVSDFWGRKKDQNANRGYSEGTLGEELQEQSTSFKKQGKSRESLKKCLDVQSERKRRHSEQSAASNKTDIESCISDERPMPHCRSTKRLELNENVLWGQSLHFALEEERNRYLNITVHAVAKLSNESFLQQSNSSGEKITKPSILGYASVYIPQIIDDCQLTLSNCHRELFTLKPPPGPVIKRTASPTVEEMSRHAGFDARLCYGDVLLSFRYFPSGLPPEANLNFEVDTSDEEVVDKVLTSKDKGFTEPVAPFDDASTGQHTFYAVSLKTAATCSICGGKVWLKSASRCSVCFMVCHNKCVAKHLDLAPPCSPNMFFDDVGFEILDSVGSGNESSLDESTRDTSEEVNTQSLPPEPPPLPPSPIKLRQRTKRRRITERVSERLSATFSRMSCKHSSITSLAKDELNVKDSVADETKTERGVVLVQSVIPDVFEQLNLSGSLCEMKYQPGNAYNEKMINAAKEAGKSIFIDLETEVRRKKINEHIGKIKAVIDTTTFERMKLLKQSNGTASEGNAEFSVLDNRLQALAVLMLHFCSALQDSNDQEENSTTMEKGQVLEDKVPESDQ